MGKTFIRYLALSLVGLLLATAGWTWLSLNWTYSDGERAGYVQKFSHKGWLCKTWEGEIALVTMPGAIPEKFEFTERDDDVARKINALAGHRVVMSYQQHKFIPVSCFGATEYFVDDVRATEEPGNEAVLPASPAPALNR